MAQFSFKRPRIISKKFPRVDSSIDSVTKSLNDLVFSYSEQVDKSLQKKHVMMAFSSLVLLLVLGSFISPKGKAESSVFYPENCLGGWVNPQYAQGEQETTSNGDETQFTKSNSAILPKNTNAEMYCGNFRGTFDQATKPTKILVSLALTKGPDLLLEETIESMSFASSSLEILDASPSSDVSFTLSSSTASTTLTLASSTEGGTATTTASSTATDMTVSATSTEGASSTVPTTPEVVQATVQSQDATPSVMTGIIESLKDTIDTLFSSDETSAKTDTVVVPTPEVTPVVEQAPVPAPEPTPAPAPVVETPAPTSWLPTLKNSLISAFFQKVFAQISEATSSEPRAIESTAPEPTPISPEPATVPSEPESPPVPPEVISVVPEATPTAEPVVAVPSTVEYESLSSISSSAVDVILSLADGSSTLSTSTLEIVNNTSSSTLTEATLTEDSNQFQNNFLEVFYSFDGVTWVSLGELNEISMKYRTFEIPVTSSTTWSDMNHLQIKVVSKKNMDDTPTIYLDGIKVEVLYETVMTHEHPDFARDTILKDEVVEGMRVLTIINNETLQQEVWYMHIDTTTLDGTASTTSATDVTASSTLDASSTLVTASTTHSSSTESTAQTSNQLLTQEIASTGTSTEVMTTGTTSSTSPLRVVTPPKWKKYDGKDTTIATALIVDEIKKQEALAVIEAQVVADALPNFALDTVKRMKGAFLNMVIVQVQKGTSTDELWLYNATDGTQEKIGANASSTVTSVTIAPNTPLGLKGKYVFWLSVDGDTVYTYDLETKTIVAQALPAFDSSLGERAEMTFDGILWKVIMNNEGFSFYSEATGEVFSDEDSRIVEALRVVMGLDAMLDKDTLSNLNLPVSAEPIVENITP